ncbi:MAG: HAMP domain-containing protein [Anaerolineae bacterium]|nr:HAMP domain-containing protein [Anaerolineae bacterium]
MRIANRLWVRLSLAFGSVFVMSGVIIAITSSVLAGPRNAQGVISDEINRPDGLVSQLQEYYQTHDGWTGIENFWTEHPNVIWLGADGNLTLSVTDLDGVIISGTQIGRKLTDQQLKDTVPIVVDGQPRGYLLFERVTLRPPNNPNGVMLQRLTETLINVLVIVGLVSIFAGIWTSRSLTAPLTRLAEAARSIGAQRRYVQVKVEGAAEIKQVAHAFNEMTKELERAEQLRRNLVADVAHELRTPLTVLQGNLQAVLDDVYPLEKAEISKLYDQTRVLSRLVSDLHELSQAEASKLSLNKQPVDLTKLVNAQVETFSALAEQEHIGLSADVPTQPLVVSGDPTRLSQVLSNLIANALAHTPAEGSIQVSLVPEPTALTIRVKDSGEGISPEHLPHVFERFYRADPSRNRQTGGAGLGLAIARAFTEAHGGSISAASEGRAGAGSTFTIRLPRLQEKSV